ncbi:MAG TPA: DNA recombination protein RmuC [Acidobacteriaceae bacterium]
MLILILAVQAVVLFLLIALLLRKPVSTADPRLAQLPDAVARLEAQTEATDRHLADSLSRMRTEAGESAQQARDASSKAFADLRTEVTGTVNSLGSTLNQGLADFRADNAASANALRNAVNSQLDTLSQRLVSSANDTARQQTELRESLNQKFSELSTSNAQGLAKMNEDNSKKLEEMRATVDEKLQTTLQTRLTESFGAVSDQLSKVHAGLGEMNTLTAGVNDLNRIFSNVKSRGGFAEVQLGKLLDQVLAPAQYVANANVRPGTQEVVEYAVRFPGSGGEVLLPIDAKFPREDWERLESAYESGVPEQIEPARKAFDAAIRTEGKRICSKYINEPITTPYAIMFLPTESLYSEVLRRDGLQADLHLNCRVMVAGPTNLYALLTSFQLGFKMLNLQQKGDEVWKILAATQTEFGKFGDLMSNMEKQVGTVQNTIQKLGVRTRAINRTLRDVSQDSGETPILPGIIPALAALDDDDGADAE